MVLERTQHSEFPSALNTSPSSRSAVRGSQDRGSRNRETAVPRDRGSEKSWSVSLVDTRRRLNQTRFRPLQGKKSPMIGLRAAPREARPARPRVHWRASPARPGSLSYPAQIKRQGSRASHDGGRCASAWDRPQVEGGDCFSWSGLKPWLLQSGSVDREAALPMNRAAEKPRSGETA